MPGRSSRTKGASGEREFFKLLNDHLGYEAFKRNLVQTREGGADSETDLPVSIEVKRQEKLSLPAWLQQSREQAKRAGKVPVLAYRRSREPWTILVEMSVEQLLEYTLWLNKSPKQS